MQVKLCECGCGQPTKMIVMTSKRNKRIKGEYNKFLLGHQNKGEGNHNYKNGVSFTQHYCKKCGNPISLSSFYRTKLCKSCSCKGENNGNYIDGRTDSKTYCKECGKLLSLYTATYCGHCRYLGDRHYMYGKHHTEEHKRKVSEAERGEKHNNWKGGITPLHQTIRRCFEYRQWRDDVYTRDNFACQECGDAIGGNLRAHHKIEFADILERHEILTLKEALNCEELWNINNGVTLCEDCHIELHKERSKCLAKV